MLLLAELLLSSCRSMLLLSFVVKLLLGEAATDKDVELVNLEEDEDEEED